MISVKELARTLQQEKYDIRNVAVYLEDETGLRQPLAKIALDKDNGHLVLSVEKTGNEKVEEETMDVEKFRNYKDIDSIGEE